MYPRWNEYRWFIELERSFLWIALCIWEQPIDEFFSFGQHFCLRRESDNFHWSSFPTVVENLSMNVYPLIIAKLFYELLGLFNRLFVRVWIMPGKISRVRLRTEVFKRVWKLYFKVLVLFPGERSLAALPLHRVWADSIDGAQPHFIELGLLHHTLDIECESLSLLDALHTKIKPRIVVSTRLIR